MMKKTTLREIRQSLGRYLAIFAIVALGVGFFAGLKVTKTVMVESAHDYLLKHQLFDYRLLSTLGFQEEDVQALEQKEHVRAVEGAVEADILYVYGEGNEGVLKAHTLLERINGLELVAGRMPETSSECIVDANRYGEEALGSKIILSENNEQKDLDNFAFPEYTIVGIAQASAYIQFERGNSSLGNGRVDGFMYLLPQGFATDYYTEIYVKFDMDHRIYSPQYDAYMAEREPQWKEYCQEQGERRYLAVVEEAQTELADAKKDLEKEKAEAEKELAGAEQELKEAEAEIADGEAKLAEGEAKIANQLARIEREEEKLTEARAAIEQQKDGLAEAEQALASSEYLPQMAAARQQLELAERQLADGEAALADAKKQIENAQAELTENRQKLTQAREELNQGREEYRSAREEFEKQMAEAEQKIADAETDIAAIQKPRTYVLGRDTNVGYALFENDSSIVEGIANVFPVFFFLVAALVCMTTMNRMVEEQRTQIGVLKALGYGNGSIMGKYLFYAGSAALGGCAAGYFLGIFIFPLVIWKAYAMMYRLGNVVFVFDWLAALLCLGASLLCSMGTTWVSCRHTLKASAAGLMRPKAPKAGKRIFLERMGFLWNRLKFLHKVSIRNIVRYKKRLFMMVLGISGCTALLVTGFGVRDSVTSIADQQYEEIQTYQLNITLDDEAGENETLRQEIYRVLDTLGGEYTCAYETSLDLQTSEGPKSVNLIVAENPSEFGAYIDLHTPSGEAIPYPGPGEIVLCDKLAGKYRIKAGDSLRLRSQDGPELSAVMSGVCENYIFNYAYVDRQTYEEALGPLTFKNLYVNLPQEADVHEVSAALMNLEHVASVQVNADMLVRFSSMMSSMNYIVFVVIGCAAALAFIVLYNLNNINITERIREIATIKVLGFYRNETSSYVFRENTVLTAMGCALGLVLGKLLHIYVMHEVDIDMISFDVHVRPVSYLLSVLLTFAFTWIVNRIMAGKLNRINMAESLKSVD
ncbi:MAG: FtsX-like permease family protein [Lachnospiraceae bacterium]|nr:FtsX-like permease family protein [Lachnospiraceae bacterium]